MIKKYKCRYCGFSTTSESTAKAHRCVSNISASYRSSPDYSSDAWLGAFMIESSSRGGGVFESDGGSFGGSGSSSSWGGSSSCDSGSSSSSCDSGGGGGGD